MTTALLALLLATSADAAVRIECPIPGSCNYGSGTVVACQKNRSLILTARHVVGTAGAPVRVILAGKTYAGVTVGYGDVGDVAAVVVNATLPAAKIGTVEPAKGTQLTQWGYPGGGEQTKKSGTVLSRSHWSDWSTLDVNGGDSGAGVFTPDNLLVGVTHSEPMRVVNGQWTDIPGRGIHVRLGTVRVFLASVAKLNGFPKLAAEMSTPTTHRDIPLTASAPIPDGSLLAPMRPPFVSGYS